MCFLSWNLLCLWIPCSFSDGLILPKIPPYIPWYIYVRVSYIASSFRFLTEWQSRLNALIVQVLFRKSSQGLVPLLRKETRTISMTRLRQHCSVLLCVVCSSSQCVAVCCSCNAGQRIRVATLYFLFPFSSISLGAEDTTPSLMLILSLNSASYCLKSLMQSNLPYAIGNARASFLISLISSTSLFQISHEQYPLRDSLFSVRSIPMSLKQEGIPLISYLKLRFVNPYSSYKLRTSHPVYTSKGGWYAWYLMY